MSSSGTLKAKIFESEIIQMSLIKSISKVISSLSEVTLDVYQN
jgi:hypothetical protein